MADPSRLSSKPKAHPARSSGAVPDGAVPDGAVPDGAVPDGAVPDRPRPEEDLTGRGQAGAGALAGDAARAYQSLRGRNVRVVDDDLRNVFAITSILELYGLTVIHAASGHEGIETLRREPGIDLVLMDVMMPEMDGYATTAAIREIPQFAQLPVIAVTARAMQGDRDKSLAAGASDYVTKPVDTDELLNCIKRWLPAVPAGH